MSTQAKQYDYLLCRALCDCPSGLTTNELARRLKVRPHQLMLTLRDLQTNGLVRFKNGAHWQWIGKNIPACGPQPANNNELSACHNHNAHADPRPQIKTIIQRSLPSDTRWDTFRRLCLYYAECVRLEDKARVSEYAEQENNRFLTLSGGVDWQGLSLGARQSLRIAPEWGPFIRTIRSKRSTSTRLFLGMPVDVFISKPTKDRSEYKIISPVFVQQVEFSIREDSLLLTPVTPVEMNHGWLERRIKGSDQARAFAEICGFGEPESEFDDQEQEHGHAWQSCITSFVGATKACFNAYRDWWQDSANPDDIQVMPSWDQLQKKGLYNRAVLMSQRALKYSRKLHQDLLWIAYHATDDQLDKTALRLLFPHKPPSHKLSQAETRSPTAEPQTLVAAFEALNREQKTACALALKEPLTVITGPPGTGKSRVVAQIMSSSAVSRKSVLFASRNHQALEAVIPRLNELANPNLLAVRLNRPFGDDHAVSLIQVLINVLAAPKPPNILTRLKQASEDLKQVLSQRDRIEEQLQHVFQTYEDVNECHVKLEEALHGLSETYAQVVYSQPQIPGEDELLKAVKSINHFRQPPERTISRLFWRLDQWWKGRRLVQAASSLDAIFAECFNEQPVGHMSVYDRSRLNQLVLRLDHWLAVAKAISKHHLLTEASEKHHQMPGLEKLRLELNATQQRATKATQRVLHLLSTSYGSGLSGEMRQRFAEIRGELLNAGENADQHSRKVQKALSDSFANLIEEVPLWATANLSAGRTVPRSAAAFDLLIVDEASQCDIASVIPLLFRARRVVVAGDPMQLPHISTMGRDTDKQVRAQLGLLDTQFGRFTYRVNSFYDLASTDANMKNVQLQDHHRSHEAIAGYVNKVFYTSTLRVMTDPRQLVIPRRNQKRSRGFEWTHLPSDVEAAPGGGSVSKNQIEAIVEELHRLSKEAFSGTVGVVTPFRVQANRIRDRVCAEMGNTLPPQWKFHVDTADGFQGDERDVMLLSIPGGKEMARGSGWFLQSGRNRFNVAVSRARALLHIFADQQWCRECGVPHLVSLYESWQKQEQQQHMPYREDLVGPVWEPALAAALRAEDISFHQQYPACGRYLDFAIFANDAKIDIEVDGEAYHRESSGERKIDDLYRDLTLIAAGWHVKRFWVYELRENMAACVAAIRAIIDQSHATQHTSKPLQGTEYEHE